MQLYTKIFLGPVLGVAAGAAASAAGSGRCILVDGVLPSLDFIRRQRDGRPLVRRVRGPLRGEALTGGHCFELGTVTGGADRGALDGILQ